MSTGGAVDWNLPANAGDMGSVLGLGRFPCQNNETHMPHLLSLHATITEAHTPRACAHQQEKPPQ